MKAVSILVVVLFLGAFGLLGSPMPAMAQCVPDIPTGSAMQPQAPGDDSGTPATAAVSQMLPLPRHFLFLGVATWSLPLPQLRLPSSILTVSSPNWLRNLRARSGRTPKLPGR